MLHRTKLVMICAYYASGMAINTSSIIGMSYHAFYFIGPHPPIT